MMFTKMRKNAWVLAFIFWVGGDLITTYFGMHTVGIIERNILVDQFFNNGNYMALFWFKFIPFMAFYVLDRLLFDIIEDWAIPLIPILLIFDGIKITLANIRVLEYVGADPFIVYVTIAVFSFVVIQFVDIQSNYTD